MYGFIARNASQRFATLRNVIAFIACLSLGSAHSAQQEWIRPTCADPVIQPVGVNTNFFRDSISAITSGDLAKRSGEYLDADSQGVPMMTLAPLQNGYPKTRSVSRVFIGAYQRPLRMQSGGPLRLVLRYSTGGYVPVGETRTVIDLIGTGVTPDGQSSFPANIIEKYYLLDLNPGNGLPAGALSIFVTTANSVEILAGNLDMKLELWVDENHQDAFALNNKDVFFDQYITRLQDLDPGFIRTGPNWSNNNTASPLSNAIGTTWTPVWSQRPLPNSPQWSNPVGVPWEVHAWLANELNVDLWICLPFMQFDPFSTDDVFDAQRLAAKTYVQGVASVIKAELNAGLHVNVEFSNEAWNNRFTTNKYLESQVGGVATAQAQHFAEMTADVFDWFLDAWYPGTTTQSDCVVRLVAMGSTADTIWAQKLVDVLGPLDLIDALGCAIYFAPDQDLFDKWETDAAAGTLDLVEIDDDLNARIADPNGGLASRVIAHANIAKANGLKLYMYEGGSSLISAGHAALQQFFVDYEVTQMCADRLKQTMDLFVKGTGGTNDPDPLVTQYGYYSFCQEPDNLNGTFLLISDLYAGTPESRIDVSDQLKFDTVKAFNANN